MTIECPKCKTNNPDSKKFFSDCATSLDIDVSQTKTFETPTDEFTRGYTFVSKHEITEELDREGMFWDFKVLENQK